MNPYEVNHTPLKRARLPVPPLSRGMLLFSNASIISQFPKMSSLFSEKVKKIYWSKILADLRSKSCCFARKELGFFFERGRFSHRYAQKREIFGDFFNLMPKNRPSSRLIGDNHEFTEIMQNILHFCSFSVTISIRLIEVSFCVPKCALFGSRWGSEGLLREIFKRCAVRISHFRMTRGASPVSFLFNLSRRVRHGGFMWNEQRHHYSTQGHCKDV